MKRFNFDPNDILQQKSKNRFSFPFNGEGDVKNWIDRVKPYAYFIHDIYFACPNVVNFFSNRMVKDYSNKCIELCNLLEKNDWHPNCVVVLNDNTPKALSEKKELIKIVIDFIDRYNIYGCVVSDFDIACMLKELRPNVVLNTSCNVPQYQISSLDCWRDFANITLVNPNRPMARNIPYLKKLKNAGYKIKLLINEKCSIICPNYICSCSRFEQDSQCAAYVCKTTPLQSCIVLPRWLNELDEYVDIYKLTGRMFKLDYVLNQLELYILRTDNCLYNELHQGCNIPLNCKDIPDHLLHCNYTNCNQCGKCKELMIKFAKSYIKTLPNVIFTP